MDVLGDGVCVCRGVGKEKKEKSSGINISQSVDTCTCAGHSVCGQWRRFIPISHSCSSSETFAILDEILSQREDLLSLFLSVSDRSV